MVIMKGHGSWSMLTSILGIVLGALLFYHGFGGNALEPMFVLFLGVIIAIIGIVGLVT